MLEVAGTLRSSALELEPMVSYAGNQEDVRLRRVVELLPDHGYVDVGAGDPVEGSVTYWLWTQGWRGVLVEPGARRELLAQARPGDVVLAAAVGGIGEVVLYETAPDAGMSTMRADRLAQVLALGQTVREVRMPAVSLTEVFERAPGPVSVLSVDVEGAEGDVLGSLDWEAHRPAVVVVEAILPWQAVSTRADFEHHLHAAGYHEAAFDGVNAWYVDGRLQQAGELRAALAYPVSLLDRWESAATVATRERAAAAEQRVEVAEQQVERAEQRSKQLQAELAAATDERDRLASDIEELRCQRRTLAERLAAARDRLEGLEQAQQHLEEQLDRTTAEQQHLGRQLDEVLASTTWRYGAPVAHALSARARRVRRLSDPATAVRQARGVVLDQVERARLRRAGPEGRAELAVVRHTAPAFLRAGAVTPCAAVPVAGSWAELAARLAQDDDTALRERLERRTGVRDPLERSVLLATLAEAVVARGSKSLGPVLTDSATDRHTVVLDARSLQDPGLSMRGVGQYARELLAHVTSTGDPVVLLVDPALPPLDGEASGREQVTVVSTTLAARTRWLVQPSPMTHDQWPLTPLLDDARVWCTTVVHDLIPARYPAVYLPTDDDFLRHAARQQVLRLYDEILANSHATLAEVASSVGPSAEASVVWPALDRPASGGPPARRLPPLPQQYVLVVGGHEHRKNLVAGLGAVALLGGAASDLPAVVLGWSGPGGLVQQWAEDAGLGAGRVQVLPYLDDDQAAAVRRGALAAVVPSFAEGLSLPVVECLRDGCPVVASSIPPHRELLGDGVWLGDPARPGTLATALSAVVADRDAVLTVQLERLAAHVHTSVEGAVVARHRALRHQVPSPSRAARRGARPSLAVVTPWPPQRSGIADYSAVTLAPLAAQVDLLLAVSATAQAVEGPGLRVCRATVAEPLLAAQDELLTVLGNSHFHLPGLEVVEARGGVALCHDVRLTELNSYLGLQDSVGDPRAPAAGRRTLRHELDAAPSLGFAHVARSCRLLLFHSAAAAERVAAETGAKTAALPFVPYRMPSADERTPEARQRARQALGLDDGQVHLGLLGGVDVRTKAADVILEAQAWLRDWGLPVVLHVVGGVDPVLQKLLDDLVRQAGTTAHVRWHGHVDGDDYRRWLLGVDLGVQLRSAALLTLSGAVADLAAFGVPSVATAAMVEDMGLPGFVRTVPDDFSPLLVAEALEAALQDETSPEAREEQRQSYLRVHSVQAYGEQLLRELGMESG